MTARDLIAKRHSWHRWAWLILAFLWLAGFIGPLREHPNLVSSLGVTYKTLALAPFLLMLAHFAWPTLLTWLILLSAWTTNFVAQWYKEAVNMVFLIGLKFTWPEVIAYNLLMALLLLTSLGAFFYLRPRIPRVPRARLTTRSS